ncbi:MAG TPA: hypothetical protein VF082_12655 [Jiangellaceae bacterium]
MTSRNSHLRPVDDLIAPDVAKTLAALTSLAPEDTAAVRLARRYAAAIDDAPADERVAALGTFGPKLLAVLEQLGATPKARAARKGEAPSGTGRLAALRAARPA